ncbi:hypothetical protein FH972_012595 [Carpinus fangiana]|uniref:Uncharacterized protein n=1 Tax=Carpinus fangiana TaxID=176857 RepID=A0A5N6R5S8_9ROSI|nr:hypothetical protein FH972_012595 [Carpinus fangiana]
MAWVFKHYLYAKNKEGQERSLSIQLYLKTIKWNVIREIVGGMSICGVGCKRVDRELCWAFCMGGEKEMKVRYLKKGL